MNFTPQELSLCDSLARSQAFRSSKYNADREEIAGLLRLWLCENYERVVAYRLEGKHGANKLQSALLHHWYDNLKKIIVDYYGTGAASDGAYSTADIIVGIQTMNTETTQEAYLFREAYNSLTVANRDIIDLLVIRGLSIDEISKTKKRTKAHISVRKNKAINSLKLKLSEPFTRPEVSGEGFYYSNL
jgi:Co/Zn/Cd efflux system component